MAAQVDGVDAVARRVERAGEPGVAGAVLGEAVRDLDDRARAPVRQPAARQKPRAVLGAKEELAPRHVLALRAACGRFDPPKLRPARRAVKPPRRRRPNSQLFAARN